MNKTLISVSTLPAENNLLAYVKRIENYADFLHCDIMDGSITENKTKLDYSLIEKINTLSTIPLEAHLMIKNPKKVIDEYKTAGVNAIIIQYEAIENNYQIIKLLKQIKDRKTLCGISFDLSSPINNSLEVLEYCDIVQLMSVKFGKSGQEFNNIVIEKLKQLFEYKTKHNLNFKIEVDGGINNTNCSILIQNGADILVSGSYVFNENNYQQAIESLKKQ